MQVIAGIIGGPEIALIRPNTGAPGYDDHETSLIATRLRAAHMRSGLSIVHQGPKGGFSESRTKAGSPHFGLTTWLKFPRVVEGGIDTPPKPLARLPSPMSISPPGVATILRVPDGGHEILHLSISSPRIAEALDLERAGGSALEIPARPMVADPVAHLLTRKLATEAFGGGPAAAALIDGLFLELIVHLLRAYGGGPSPPPTPGGLSDICARRVAAYVDAHLTLPISLAELADVAGYSPYHFSRLFKARFGLTPHAYIVQRRLDRAVHMLRSRRASITEITFACGFSTQQQFTATFARAFGVPPGRWRASVLD